MLTDSNEIPVELTISCTCGRLVVRPVAESLIKIHVHSWSISHRRPGCNVTYSTRQFTPEDFESPEDETQQPS